MPPPTNSKNSHVGVNAGSVAAPPPAASEHLGLARPPHGRQDQAEGGGAAVAAVAANAADAMATPSTQPRGHRIDKLQRRRR